jgi:plasmid stabilization system protein ParE
MGPSSTATPQRNGTPAASRLVAELDEAAARLIEHPNRSRPSRVPGTRELVVSGISYLIPYRVRGGIIEILRVFHGFHGTRGWPEDRTRQGTGKRRKESRPRTAECRCRSWCHPDEMLLGHGLVRLGQDPAGSTGSARGHFAWAGHGVVD